MCPFPKIDAIVQRAPTLGLEQLQELTHQAGGGGAESFVTIHSQRSPLVSSKGFALGIHIL